MKQQNTEDRNSLIAVFGGLLIAGGIVFGRMLLHDANFTPVIAFALLAGFLFRRSLFAFAGVLLGMFLSDLFLPFDGLAMRALVYLSLCLSVFLGSFLPQREGGAALAFTSRGSLQKEFAFAGFAIGSSFLGAVLFYLFTNAGVWAWSGMYAHIFEGLWQCYLNALPFFRNTLVSTLLFGVAFLEMARLLRGVFRGSLPGLFGWEPQKRDAAKV